MHAIDLLGAVQREVFSRSGVDPSEVGQVIGGCVSQVGMQTMNVTRNAWLAAGLPIEVPASTIDAQCGSSQQATNVAFSLIASGVTDTALACGVEMMSRVPMGSAMPRDPNVGKPVNRHYFEHYEFTSQFEAAERIADKRGFSREECDAFGKLSQDRAARAWKDGVFDTQILPIDAPILDDSGKPSGATRPVVRDEGLRETTLEGLAGLKPSGRPEGVHTAGTSSQIADGAGAVLLMTRGKASALGLEPIATILDVCLVGSDPELMLEGPIPATRKLLADNAMAMSEIDLIEINEAFASVVLAFEQELNPDMARVNPNGGAIALGHPLGGTGAILVAKAAHELRRTGGDHAIVTMCCGGGLGTGTLMRRG
jgi:acetyl-CoA C-acetyltransferase